MTQRAGRAHRGSSAGPNARRPRRPGPPEGMPRPWRPARSFDVSMAGPRVRLSEWSSGLLLGDRAGLLPRAPRMEDPGAHQHEAYDGGEQVEAQQRGDLGDREAP